MNIKYLKIESIYDTEIGRCTECDARDFCHKVEIFNCNCNFYEHYKYDIKLERQDKLRKISKA